MILLKAIYSSNNHKIASLSHCAVRDIANRLHLPAYCNENFVFNDESIKWLVGTLLHAWSHCKFRLQLRLNCPDAYIGLHASISG